MITQLNVLREFGFWQVLLRMGLAFVIGFVIGLERSSKNRPAGFRTHILVCLGACIASMTGHYVYLVLQLPADMTRIGASVISGLGFIGAGAIIVTRRNTVKGLTTAAGLWTTGVIGVALGSGFYEASLIAAVLVIIAETYFSKVSLHIRHATEYSVALQYVEKASLDHVLRGCRDHNNVITSLRVTGRSEEEPVIYSAEVSLRANKSIDPEVMVDYIQSVSGIINAHLIGEVRN